MQNTLNRKTFLFASMIAAIAAAVWYFNVHRDEQTIINISPRVVKFPGMQLRPGGDKASFKLAGRIRNTSPRFTITGIVLKLTMEDVLVSGASTNAGTTTVLLKQVIPPNESCYFEEPVAFSDLSSPRGRHEWNYQVVEAKGK